MEENFCVVSYDENSVTLMYDNGEFNVYDTGISWDIIVKIFADDGILKIISKPYQHLQQFLSNNPYKNCLHISEYMRSNDRSFDISDMKRKIILIGNNKSSPNKQIQICKTLMEYKLLSDENTISDIYNYCREELLLYLTIFNEIISQCGSINAFLLIRKSKKYIDNTMYNYNPYHALNILIKTKCLSMDPLTTNIDSA